MLVAYCDWKEKDMNILKIKLGQLGQISTDEK